MTDYYSLNDLPKLTSYRRVKQVSSFDRREENADYGQYLRYENENTAVLLDEKGSGCIRSMWFAVTSDEAVINFWFDGEETPRYSSPLKSFIKNGVGEITGDGVTYEQRGQWEGGDCFCGNIFVPVPFEKSLKITSVGKNDFYYHILYEMYAEDAPENERGTALGKAYKEAFSKKLPERKPANYEKDVVLDCEYTDVYHFDGSGVITELTVEADEETDISNVLADISFDGDTISYVACPLSHLFAEPIGFNGISTVAAHSRKENGKIIYSCYLPMPFWSKCAVCFVNTPKDGIKLKVRMRIEENTYDPDTTGYFHADFRKGLTELFDDWLLGEFHGRGSIVGLVQTCKGGQWCEGNEHFFIDGELSPSINGTGTEDLYLGCYWPNVKYDSPVAGCVKNIMDGGYSIRECFDRRAGYYRFFHDIPISFENGIKLTVQHGAVGQTYSDYSSCVFSYRQELSGMRQTDFIDVSSEASRLFHDYKATNTEQRELTSKLEGDRKAMKLSRRGISHKNGVASFKAAIDPENNGVVLRMLTELSKEIRNAKVKVDGVFVGELYDSEYNDFASFGDIDFMIPPSATKGKALINIELDGTFTDFEYKVFTKKK